MGRFIGILLAFSLAIPSAIVAQERSPTGSNVCRDEYPADLSGRNTCYAEWRRSALLVMRYHQTYIENQGFLEGFTSVFKFNPYRLNRRNLFGNCSAGQVFSGNFINNQFDFREVWACIARHDKEAAKWDMI